MERTNKRGKAHKVYIYFLIRVLPILVVPIFVMTAIYYWSAEVIKQQTYEKNLAVLQSSAETIKKTFDNMDNLIAYISSSPSINRFFTTVNPVRDGSTTTDMLKIQGELKALTTANDLIENIQVYSGKNNILIDSTTNALFIDRYYSSYFTIDNMTFDDWYQNILSTPHNYDIYSSLNVTSLNHTRKSLLYAKSLPLVESRDIDGGIFIFLDEAYLLKLFSNIPYKDSGFIYIFGKNGIPILYDNNSGIDNPAVNTDCFTCESGYFRQNIKGSDMFVTYLDDKSRNWIYVAAIPQKDVLAPTAGIRYSIGILIVLSLITGGALLILSVAKLTKPITNIFSLLSEKNDIVSYSDFEYKISWLVKSNQEMQEALDSQIPEIKTSIFYNFLLGRFRTSEEVYDNLSKINIRLDANFYVVLIASINDLDPNSNLEEISARKLLINGVISQNFSNLQGIYNLDYERTVLLLSYNQPNYADVVKHVESVAEHIVEQLFSSAKVSISFSGDIARNVMKIPSSFFNANTAINYRQKNLSYTVQWFNKSEDKLSFYYPIELESQLIAQVNVGNKEGLSELLEKIERRNKHIFNPDSNSAFFALLQSMNSTLIRVFNESARYSKQIFGLRDKIALKLEKREDLIQTFYLLKEAFIAIAASNRDEMSKSNRRLINQIKKYIDQQYTDPQLSLSSISNVFRITEVYISYLFKLETGENFSKYVEKLRMEKALQLIREGRHLVNEIAEMVGYNSPQVFRRAYKRYYGTTPTSCK
ncbi:MAG: AraC family transcriptional regulator [Bacillota bacterium]